MTGSANRFKNIRPIPIPNLKTRDILKVRCRSRPALTHTHTHTQVIFSL